jgi:hypothetical protein
LAESHLAGIHARLDEFDDMLCTAILIEAARVIDYENVLMGSTADESHHLPYPAFDVMCRGWNPLLHYALTRLPESTGIPIQESTPLTRSHARSLLHAFGKCVVLQKASEMALHGLLTGRESGTSLSLKFMIGEDSDHFLDQLEVEALEKALNGNEESAAHAEGLTGAEVDALAASLVFPFDTGRGTMVGYDADPRLDVHFISVIAQRATEWRAEAGIHPDTQGEEFSGGDVAAVVLMLASFYLKHICFVGVGSKQIDNVNYSMSLTIWKRPEELVDSISGFTGISVPRVRRALQAVLVTRRDAGYFGQEGTPFMPMLLELSDGYWLAPVSSIFRNPLASIRMLNEYRSPKVVESIREPREGWMISDLYALFEGNRYQIAKGPARLKRGKHIVTDIDAAVLDMTTGELAIFQLKWQDFASNRLRTIRSKAKNFVERVSKWADQVEAWIDDFGIADLCRSLKLNLPPGAALTSVKMFAIGRSNARFASYGFAMINPNVAACNWNQFVRLRYEVGPAGVVLSEIHARAFAERSRVQQRVPLPYSFEVEGKSVCFEDMWSVAQ